mgnify:CR=1 FL=1
MANIKSANNIKKIEVFFNNKLIDQQINLGKDFSYVKNSSLTNIELQNVFKITITDDLNNKTSRELILYK